jgi:hypothetical protein
MQRKVFDLFEKILMDIDVAEHQAETRKVSSEKCLLLLFFLSLTILAVALSSVAEFVTFALAMTIFTIPGLLIFRSLFWNNIFQNPEAIFFGSAFGLGLSSLLAAIAGYFIAWGFFASIGILIILSFAVYYLLRQYKSPPIEVNTSRWTKGDVWILLPFMTASIVTLIPVYLNIGEATPHGIGFAYLIGNDFVAHMNHTASLSHGIPPQYFHFAGDILRYYWLSFILPALVYSFPSERFSLISIMILNQLFFSMVFWGSLFSTMRLFARNKKILALLMLLAFCAYSYNDLYVLLKHFANRFASVSIFEIMRSNGLLNFSDLSHGFFRFYVFESQTLLGLSLLLISLFLLVNCPRESGGKNVILGLVGLVTGVTLGVEVFTGMLLASVLMAFIVAEIIVLYKKKGFNLKGIFALVQPVIILIMIYAVYFIIEMFSFGYGNQSLVFRPYKLILLTFPAYLLLEFGPLAIFGTLGIHKIIRSGNMMKRYYLFFVLLIFSFLIVLFVDTTASTVDNTGAVKGARTISLALLFFSSFLIEDVISRKRRQFLTFSCFALIVIASPTLWIDVRTLSNVYDIRNTQYVAPEDYTASVWLKHNTPNDAIVQSFSDRSAYSIATFGERKMVLGWYLARGALHDNIKAVPERLADIETVFRSSNLNRVNELIKKYGIDYLYIGPHDKGGMGKGDWKKFDQHRNLFKKIYSKDGVNIYMVRRQI